MSNSNQKSGGAPSTGHSWDGIEELTNPVPRWWIWSFYFTVVICIIYWIIYPAWPVGKSYTTGTFNDITYNVVNKETGEATEVTTHWNTRALLMADMQRGKEALKQKAYMDEVSKASFNEILEDPEKMAFARSLAKGIYGDNCAACHGTGGTGVVGLFPNLADDDWLWGGKVEQIQATIEQGRHGYMPDFKNSFNAEQLDAVTEYVLSLSGHSMDKKKVASGKRIFNGQQGGCYYCHTTKATGMVAVGSANLTDSIWTVADVQGAASLEAKKAAVKTVIADGVSRKMPAWSERLSANDIKLLTVFVHELGGGK
ncbi:MAG: c-type cytochrome [Gammaproteobacteria bacterium]|nr:c-type cytochrome [Gammaproteobacteria bacterium]